MRTAFGSEATLDYLIKGIFAVWWDKKFDHAAIAEVAVNKLLSVRSECLNDLGMGVGSFHLTTTSFIFMLRILPTLQLDITTMSTSTTLVRMETVFPQDGAWVRALIPMANPSSP